MVLGKIYKFYVSCHLGQLWISRSQWCLTWTEQPRAVQACYQLQRSQMSSLGACRVDSTHGNAFRTSTITASRSLTFISSKFCSSIVCISFCRSMRVPWKRCFISSLHFSHVANSFGNRSRRPSFIKVAKDSSSIFLERHSTISSPLKCNTINMSLQRASGAYRRRRICEAL